MEGNKTRLIFGDIISDFNAAEGNNVIFTMEMQESDSSTNKNIPKIDKTIDWLIDYSDDADYQAKMDEIMTYINNLRKMI